jgi:uncharacterized protein (UPF0332 family)
VSDSQKADVDLLKAAESLAGAESEFTGGRFNNCVNRAYYASFQAAIAALLRVGIRPSGRQWPHTFVQSEFVGKLINRRHRYPSSLRDSLAELQVVRERGDYRDDMITQTEASRALRRSREFVDAIRLS